MEEIDDLWVVSEMKRITPMLQVEYGSSQPGRINYFKDGDRYIITFWIDYHNWVLESSPAWTSSYLSRIRGRYNAEEISKIDDWFHTIAWKEEKEEFWKRCAITEGTSVEESPPLPECPVCKNRNHMLTFFEAEMEMCCNCFGKKIKNLINPGPSHS